MHAYTCAYVEGPSRVTCTRWIGMGSLAKYYFTEPSKFKFLNQTHASLSTVEQDLVNLRMTVPLAERAYPKHLNFLNRVKLDPFMPSRLPN